MRNELPDDLKLAMETCAKHGYAVVRRDYVRLYEHTQRLSESDWYGGRKHQILNVLSEAAGRAMGQMLHRDGYVDQTVTGNDQHGVDIRSSARLIKPVPRKPWDP
jgi:hypothetical protein